MNKIIIFIFLPYIIYTIMNKIIIFIFLLLILLFLFYYRIRTINKLKSKSKYNAKIKHKHKKKLLKSILKKMDSRKKYKHKKVKFDKDVKDVKDVKEENNLVYMEISIDKNTIGKIIIKLYEDKVPYTCKNFKTMCINKNNLSYKNCPFHRIIKDFMIQGGDFTNGDGTGGVSIYGERFRDENFIYKHDKPYLLSMANAGPDTNGSQFFITTVETPHLDNKHVVFGEVVKGLEIIDYINNVKIDNNDRPIQNIFISNCGVL
jgi:cyclophilin family peptidyl-prolyl cis-trans isomerase